jgi:hypothetical protein
MKIKSLNEKIKFTYISKIFKKKNEDFKENFYLKNSQIKTKKKNFFDNNSNNKILTINQEIVNETFLNKKDNLNENINKIKRGRKRKDENENFLNKKTNRTKYAKDNLIHKFKTFFYQKFLVNLLNSLIRTYYKTQIFSIKKFEGKMIKNVTIKYNLKLLNSTISKILNYDISKKYKKYELNSNQQILNIIKKVDFFKKILDLHLCELYQIYKSENCQEYLEKYYELKEKINNLNDDIDENQSENEYKNELKKMCLNIYSFFDKKKARKLKSKKKNK